LSPNFRRVPPDFLRSFFSHIVSPQNYSAKLMDKFPYDQLDYCALIAIRTFKNEPVEQMKVNTKLFVENWSSSSVKLLLPKD
ncbi:hypothetical protein, partial [Crocosphaera sp. Alani8]|uniref:hypothetical protein n=1 Tax=Crocosphaera sp. Alani8 TaxID=3038952 RepID=UPI00313B986E